MEEGVGHSPYKDQSTKRERLKEERQVAGEEESTLSLYLRLGESA